MGILDDAIREHLDLKRQHGAPEEEVQRQQDEALGPARREVGPPAEDGETVAADGEPEGAQLDEALPEDAPEPGDAAEARALRGPSPNSSRPRDRGRARAFQPEPADEDPPAPGGDTPAHEPEPEAEEEPAFEPVEPDDPFGGDEPFADEDDEADEDDGEGDVLEDTPDFLQETPEHDRLWFEQKPPRDFDFD